ncbi:alkaline phosphatase family protein [Cellulomonas bogoriensis]|uniref:Phosphodiesterase n=1 Tax=Cellulomonas bogoriensis 69B4 = DSM 16987 TaxID=1386082 RepID=A0A0A0C279_9CELL|nr:nucleotide pyrophosphatase/phosphodiesterase family protein [Cellulomonas bogoriensis]KGM14276.1 phosphodiesterase [Cellulomonas bogoriensis 69B4 = DSM 16987]
MSHTDLTTRAAAAGLRPPDYGGRCLDSVLPAAAAALGAGDEADEAARHRLDLPRAPRVCVVLVDGMGYELLARRATHAPFLAGLLDAGDPLTTGFPTTTATAMGLFGTGRPAGLTGMAGYTVRNPTTGTLANLVSWDGAPPARQWQREPSVFERLTAKGIEVTSVAPARFGGSGLTDAVLGGGRFVAAESLRDRVDATVFELSAPGLVYLYWGEVDKIGHQHGWRSREWAEELAATDREISRLARSLPPGTLLMITADHGMVDVDPRAIVDVARNRDLLAGVDLVAGEPRAAHVHVRPGQQDAVLSRWRSRLEGTALVASRDEAVAAGWFGPVAEHVLPVLGDLVVLATGSGGVGDSRTQTQASLALRGMHGSLTSAELDVPLLVVA